MGYLGDNRCPEVSLVDFVRVGYAELLWCYPSDFTQFLGDLDIFF